MLTFMTGYFIIKILHHLERSQIREIYPAAYTGSYIAGAEVYSSSEYEAFQAASSFPCYCNEKSDRHLHTNRQNDALIPFLFSGLGALPLDG
ncbi:Uncharacterised protein [Chlamydia abortus]|nr:Uncharacterised protein [Chlamydia abortus]